MDRPPPGRCHLNAHFQAQFSAGKRRQESQRVAGERGRCLRDAITPSRRAAGPAPSPAHAPLRTFLILDLEAGWKSFLHMKLANDLPILDPERRRQTRLYGWRLQRTINKLCRPAGSAPPAGQRFSFRVKGCNFRSVSPPLPPPPRACFLLSRRVPGRTGEGRGREGRGRGRGV